MGDATTQQNTADRSGNEDSTSMPTSTAAVPFFLIGEAAFLSPLFKTFRLVELEKIFSYLLAVV